MGLDEPLRVTIPVLKEGKSQTQTHATEDTALQTVQTEVPSPGAPGHHHSLSCRQYGKGVVWNKDSAEEPSVQREVGLSLVHTWPFRLSLLPEGHGFAPMGESGLCCVPTACFATELCTDCLRHSSCFLVCQMHPQRNGKIRTMKQPSDR